LEQTSHVAPAIAADKSPMFASNGEGFVIGRTAGRNFDLPVKNAVKSAFCQRRFKIRSAW
jgi:hypothetical protein